MIRRDYLMRLIEQFVEALSKLLKLKANKNYEEALSLIGQTYEELLGFDSLFVNSFSTEDLISIISIDGVPDVNKCIIIATLLKEEGEIYEAQNQKDISRMRYLKSLDIFLRGFLSEGEIKMDISSYEMEKIVEKLGKKNLTPEIKKRLSKYYENFYKDK
jgi:hypothetical protein